MIISASRRTDIPAFYSEWMINRISDGYVLVRNPMNIHQISRISLAPSVIDCIVFWTKNPQRFLDKLPLLSKYNYYFQFTITPYDQRFEPNVAPKDSILSVFRKLSSLIGKNRVIWRYDPIFITDEISLEWQQKKFEYLSRELSGFTDKCVISFLDIYKKCKKNLYGIKLVDFSSQRIKDLTKSFVRVASKTNIQIVSCGEETDLSNLGVLHGKCIDDKLIAEISGFDVIASKDKTQRAECGCVASIDIGAYNTCPHGCLYCYANYDSNAVRRNYATHIPSSPLLFGEVGKDDRIIERKMVSCIDMQKHLFK